jgi:cytochrome c oxidase subunit IV
MARAQMHMKAGSYVVTWAVLLVLAAATYGLSRLDLGAWQVAVALGIAVVKGLLVALVFMHLLEHGAVNRVFFGVAFGFIVLLIGLTTADIVTREPTQLPVPAIPVR